NGTLTFLYNIGRAFYGSSTGSATSLTESVTTNFVGGANAPLKLNPPAVGHGNVTLVWSAVEGGTYQVEASTNLFGWVVLVTNVSPNQKVGGYTNVTPDAQKSFRVARTALANYDGYTGGGSGL